MTKRVVVIGGGYAGVTLARALDEAFDVVLLERKDCFYHNVGAMRAYADPALYDRLLIPYTRLLRRGRVVQDEAVRVVPGGVRGLAASYEADITVVATGSRHAMPFKSNFTDSTAFLKEARALSAGLQSAETVAILGDGPVAVELAGEIGARYPEKRLTLVSAGSRLLPNAGNPRLGERILRLLRDRKVTVLFGRREASAEFVIHAYGAELSVPCLDSPGRVNVDPRFRVAGKENVYAIGDAANCGEPPLTFLARRQALRLAALLQGSHKEYKPVKWVALSVPLGPDAGATQLPLPGLPVAGSWLTSLLKGRGLFVAANWARMGMGGAVPPS